MDHCRNSYTRERKIALVAESNEFFEKESWEKYIACSPLPHPEVEHEITAWISLWRDRKEEELGECLGLAESTAQTVDELVQVLAKKEAERDYVAAENLSGYRQQLRSVTEDRINLMTAGILQVADVYATAKNEVQLHHQTPHIRYGLWVNLARNPRVKQIDFENLHFSCEITKSLAIANIAIRLTHTTYDSRTEGANNKHVPLGGIFSYDLLALPAAPKRVKAWTLRQVTQLSTTLQRLPYPLQSSDPAGGVQTVTPIRISYALPAECLLKEEVPTIGWWDEAAKEWKTDGVTEPRFDESTRTVSCLTTHLGPIAVLLNRYPDLRFERWELQPTGPDRAVFTLHVTGRDVAIEVAPGGARLITPKDKELTELQTNLMPVRFLLHRLSQCGIYILPSEEDIHKLNGANVKDRNLLFAMHQDISLFAASYAFASSRWNREGAIGSRACVFRTKEYLKFDAPLRLDEDELWYSVLYKDNHDVLLIAATESADSYDDTLVEGQHYHLSLYNTLKSAGISQEVPIYIHTYSHIYISMQSHEIGRAHV